VVNLSFPKWARNVTQIETTHDAASLCRAKVRRYYQKFLGNTRSFEVCDKVAFPDARFQFPAMKDERFRINALFPEFDDPRRRKLVYDFGLHRSRCGTRRRFQRPLRKTWDTKDYCAILFEMTWLSLASLTHTHTQHYVSP